MTRDDVRALRTPLLALAATVLVAAAALYDLQQRIQRADSALRQEQARVRETRMRLQQSGAERDLIVRHLENYRRLEQAGFIASAQRIDWTAALRAANQTAGLFGVSYQISAQHPYARAHELNAPQLVVRESVMRLTAGLLHEEDLPTLLASLSAQKVGLFVPQQCSLKRIPGRTGLRDEPHLDGECLVSWLTAEPKRGMEGS